MKKLLCIFLMLAFLLVLGVDALAKPLPGEAQAFFLKIKTEHVDLVKQVTTLETDIKNLQEKISLLNEEMLKLKKAETAVTSSASFRWDSITKNPQILNFLNDARTSLGLLGIILLLLVWRFRPSVKRNQKKHRPESIHAVHIPDANTYQYRAPEESSIKVASNVPAKLNLAHAYIAMEDYLAARKILEEVAEKGSSIQQEEAKRLLSSFAPAS